MKVYQWSGILLFVFVLLSGCSFNEKEKQFDAISAADNDFTESGKPAVQQWFDYYNNVEMGWNDEEEISLDAFPGVTFRWTYENLEAVIGDEITPLYTGMPIWSVYFTDLTGDGLPELCSTVSFGSGMIDERLIIYDYANEASYTLEDRGKYDYSLSLQNEQLTVTKRMYNSKEIVETGHLVYEEEGIHLAPIEDVSSTDIGDQAEQITWSEQDIICMFSDIKEEDWDYIDCVLMPDYAYERIGAVLFWDGSKGTSNVAFFDENGTFQQCGTDVKTAEEPDFTYLGNGAVTFKLENEDGGIYNYTLTFSIDGSDVHFKVGHRRQKAFLCLFLPEAIGKTR